MYEQKLYVYADCQNCNYQLEQRRMAGPPFLALTKSHVLTNKIKLVVIRESYLLSVFLLLYMPGGIIVCPNLYIKHHCCSIEITNLSFGN